MIESHYWMMIKFKMKISTLSLSLSLNKSLSLCLSTGMQQEIPETVDVASPNVAGASWCPKFPLSSEVKKQKLSLKSQSLSVYQLYTMAKILNVDVK